MTSTALAPTPAPTAPAAKTWPVALPGHVATPKAMAAVTLALAAPARRHAPVGALLDLDRGAPPARCNLRARLMFGPHGVIRVMGPDGEADPRHAASGEGLRALLYAAEQGAANAAHNSDRLAVACGYADYATLWADLTDGRKRQRIARDVIGLARDGAQA